jgi:hypothetical protein
MLALVCGTLVSGSGLAADGWEVFGAEQLGLSRDQLMAQIALECEPAQAASGLQTCKPAPEALRSLAGVPAQQVELKFREGQLEKVSARLNEANFEALEQYLAQRYGPGEDRSYRFRSGMGAELTNRVLLWRTERFALVIQQFAGKIDRSSLSCGTHEAMAEIVREKTSYQPGSRREF